MKVGDLAHEVESLFSFKPPILHLRGVNPSRAPMAPFSPITILTSNGWF